MFEGETYSPPEDYARLKSNLERLLWWAHREYGQQWRSLGSWASLMECSEAGASARLRDLRKPHIQAKYGKWNVERRRVKGGLWEYRVTRAAEVEDGQLGLFDG